MREILFRGKNLRGDWVYGSLIHYQTYCCILKNDIHGFEEPYLDNEIGWIDGQATPVVPETVGQWTGMTDKNGKKVFEGDTVKTKYGRLCNVIWFSSQAHCGWDLEAIMTCENTRKMPPTIYDLYRPEYLEVVGNIYE